MSIVDDPRTFGRTRLSFASETEIDEFVETLNRFERGELSPDEWRRYRLVRGTYGQRQTEDAHMVRVKIPQGILSGAQLRTLADVSARFSRGFGHVTTRQNVQFHFVRLHDVEHAMRVLADAGLTTREACGNAVRNITGCPYAGVSDDEVFDVTAYAEAMTRFLLRHPLGSTLPRKFKIAFEGCAADHALTAINDLGFRARIVDGRRGFRVTVAGGTAIMPVSGYLLFDFVPANDILTIAEAVLRVFQRFGDYEHRQRNRLKFLIRTLGWDAWKARFEDALAEVRAEPAFAEATGGKPHVRLPFDPEKPPVEREPDWPTSPPPSSAELAALASSTAVTGPGLHPGSVRLRTLDDAYGRWTTTNVRRQKQPGYALVTVRLPLGDITANQMRVVADLADAYADGGVRTTPEQNLLLRWVPIGAIDAVYRALTIAGLHAHDARTIADVVSCPGAETCRLAVTQSRGLARLLSEQLSERPDLVAAANGADIKISGCPNGCGQHHISAIGFQGSVRKVNGRALPQYFVLVGGHLDDRGAHFGRVAAKVPVRRLPDAVERLVALYRAERTEGEALAPFFERIPLDTVRATLRDLEVVSAADVSEEEFVDLEEAQAFAPEVLDGECSA